MALRLSLRSSLSFLVITILNSVSCSKKGDDVVPVTPTCQVKSITTESTVLGLSISSKTTETFEYSDNKLVKIKSEYFSNGSAGSTGITLYSYTSGVISTVAAGTASYNWTILNGNLVKVTNGGAVVTEITYSTDGTLATHVSKPASNNEVKYIPVFDNAGNIFNDVATVKSATQDEKYSRKYSGYLSGINPYSIIAKSMGLSYYFAGVSAEYFLVEAFSKNYPGGYTATQEDFANHMNYTKTFSYNNQYDAIGRLTASTQTDGQFITTKVFEYANCN